MYVCQPGFHVMFSAFAALTYIAKGIKLMLTKNLPLAEFCVR